ncbi:conserved hypothetical protein [Acinetobacter proteolyticus]|uniref:Uncharacterized protein n=1 Tax=Acinetobacter proteolyticus TaxID=1776741 RepID=A0A653K3J2_9GAMM|nr:hypothetical protein [Acinetobacter proteolyticus]VXA55312.1 conserved hypothetical protein [Acinetobacter proteolyticus]
MTFITIADAETILGADFAPDGDKARLVLLANTWMKNEIGFVPDPVTNNLKLAACEIIKGILANEIYNGKEQELKRKKVKADTVELEKEYQDGSYSLSSFEQIALALIEAENLPKHKFFTIPLVRN